MLVWVNSQCGRDEYFFFFAFQLFNLILLEVNHEVSVRLTTHLSRSLPPFSSLLWRCAPRPFLSACPAVVLQSFQLLLLQRL